MTNFDALWQQADPDAVGGGGEPPAPGHYTAALTDATIFVSRSDKTAGQPFMRFEWKDVESEHAWSVLYGFDRPGKANFAKSSARDLGVDVDAINGLDELNGALAEHVGNYFELEVVDGGDYQNSTYVRARSTTEAPNGFTRAANTGFPPPAPAGGVPDDDIPFKWQPPAWEARYHQQR